MSFDKIINPHFHIFLNFQFFAPVLILNKTNNYYYISNIMSTLTRKKTYNIQKTIPVSANFEQLSRIAQNIGPFYGLASYLKLSVDNFRKMIVQPHYVNVREAILEGEYKRYSKEQKEYEKYLNAYSWQEKLEKKGPLGHSEKYRVTPDIMRLRAGHWAHFQALYARHSLDHYLRRQAEKKQAEKESNTDSYLELRQELADHADRLAGISGRKPGDLSARPEHLLIPEILKKKASVKRTDKKKQGFDKQKLLTYTDKKLIEYKKPARKTSKILWLPDNTRKKYKKIVLTDFINNNNNCFFIKPRRQK